MQVSKTSENIVKAAVVGGGVLLVGQIIYGDLNGSRGYNSTVPDRDAVSWTVPQMK